MECPVSHQCLFYMCVCFIKTVDILSFTRKNDSRRRHRQSSKSPASSSTSSVRSALAAPYTCMLEPLLFRMKDIVENPRFTNILSDILTFPFFCCLWNSQKNKVRERYIFYVHIIISQYRIYYYSFCCGWVRVSRSSDVIERETEKKVNAFFFLFHERWKRLPVVAAAVVVVAIRWAAMWFWTLQCPSFQFHWSRRSRECRRGRRRRKKKRKYPNIACHPSVKTLNQRFSKGGTGINMSLNGQKPSKDY